MDKIKAASEVVKEEVDLVLNSLKGQAAGVRKELESVEYIGEDKFLEDVAKIVGG